VDNLDGLDLTSHAGKLVFTMYLDSLKWKESRC
jgi:hypothetical protein